MSLIKDRTMPNVQDFTHATTISEQFERAGISRRPSSHSSESLRMTTLVEQLSSYAGQLRYEDLPSEVVSRAKRLIVDSVGCALGGYSSGPAKIAREIATTVTSTQPATIMGSGTRSSLDLASFANGVMLRFLDFNDGYTSTGESGHPSDSIAAILTVAGFTNTTRP